MLFEGAVVSEQTASHLLHLSLLCHGLEHGQRGNVAVLPRKGTSKALSEKQGCSPR